MLFADIDILDENLEYRKGCYVGVKDKRIAYIGDKPPTENFGEIYSGKGRLLMTGFINAHSHSAMTLMRGYAENLTLSDWLNKKIFPFEAKLDGNAVYSGIMLAVAEMLRFGVVSTTDMYFNAEATARAVEESGIKMNFGIPATCFDERGARELPVYKEVMSSVSLYHNAYDDRMKIDMSIHSEYTSTEKTVREIADITKDTGLNMHIHLSETKDEHEACKQRHGGRTPARYFYDNGVFDSHTTAAHCVHLEGEDFDILKEKGVTAASCPVSNLKLASGFCHVPFMLEKGINVALGTDSVASNNNLNILEEVKLFAMLFKATTGNPTAITAKQALYAATRAGAIAQGRENCGALKVGNRADLIVFDLENRPYMQPCHDMVTNLVFSAIGTDICLTMIDGNILYKDGVYTAMDFDKVVNNARKSTENILKQL